MQQLILPKDFASQSNDKIITDLLLAPDLLAPVSHMNIVCSLFSLAMVPALKINCLVEILPGKLHVKSMEKYRYVSSFLYFIFLLSDASFNVLVEQK